MKEISLDGALRTAVMAAESAGQLMSRHARSPKVVHAATRHDIKLELDVRCQKRIEKVLRGGFPQAAILGEEGVVEETDAAFRWVVDPIDGTVNFAYGIPHACVSIALQKRTTPKSAGTPARARKRRQVDADYSTVVGVVLDPFTEELWTAIRGRKASLNGRPIQVSSRPLREAIVTIGFAKHRHTLELMLPVFQKLVHEVRKIRIMGSAALALTYVASGRMDAYVESGLRLWDIAAGGLILECAGGDYWHAANEDGESYRLLANNGRLRKILLAKSGF